MTELPVVIVGAGPQGLAAAAELVARGEDPSVIEQGAGPGSAVSRWAHVRLFSPWPELISPAGARQLETTGWTARAEGFPTGAEWVESYLRPLAEVLGPRVRYRTRVVGISRKGRDRLVSDGRADQPFVIHVETGGVRSRIQARAVIDASGTWTQPNPAGADGLPTDGETTAAATGSLTYQPPDPLQVRAVTGQHAVELGSGRWPRTAGGWTRRRRCSC